MSESLFPGSSLPRASLGSHLPAEVPCLLAHVVYGGVEGITLFCFSSLQGSKTLT